MSKLSVARLPEQNAELHYIEGATPAAITFFFHGKHQTLTRNAGEDQSVFFARVLGCLQDARNDIHRDRRSTLDPYAIATIYCSPLDTKSIDALSRVHMREYVMEGLHSVANSSDKSPGSGSAKVAALQLLAEMQGLLTPKKTKARKLKESSALPTQSSSFD